VIGKPSFLDESVMLVFVPGIKLDEGRFTTPNLGITSSISRIARSSRGIGWKLCQLLLLRDIGNRECNPKKQFSD
jgi:hypothetical protein